MPPYRSGTRFARRGVGCLRGKPPWGPSPMRTLSGSGRAAMGLLPHERYRVGSPRGSRTYRPIYGAPTP
ncbi:hypothetical protein DSO57_1018593 [Entomophthora muscae]|uniref:Uncharacterized protein n=1 Tax=Entomophthora muscae TaxID=34485 RepID=A0ACC2RIX1_9FUNG|nr:hypothetical protein DSO57_1018593 [Entomophthora muscae]